jgi:hypothetical protein
MEEQSISMAAISTTEADWAHGNERSFEPGSICTADYIAAPLHMRIGEPGRVCA